MRFKGHLILILLLASCVDGQRTDVVTMKNGDRLTCEITAVDHGTLYAKLDYVDDTIEINWAEVAKVESKRLFIIKTDTGAVYESTISTLDPGAGKIVKLEISTVSKTKVDINTTDIVTVEASDKKFWKRFNGSVNFGMNYAKGNDSRQYNLSAFAEYPRRTWGAQFDFSSNLQATEGVRSTTRNEFRTRFDKYLRNRKFFVTGGVGFLQSSEQSISLQSSVVGGIGYNFIDSRQMKISLIGGMGWQRTSYDRENDLTEIQNQAAVLIGTDIRYYRFKKAGLSFQASVLPSVSEPGRIFYKVNNNFYYKIFPRLTFNISFYGGWDSRPPFGLSGSDYGTTTGLGWTFGNK